MKILLLGKNGQIGWELQRTLAPLGTIIAIDREELDLINAKAIRSTVRAVKPDLIVNAAAYTAVDKAEEEQDLAMAINGIAPGVLAEEAALGKAVLVHYSTDYVFDGTKKTPYIESDIPKPLNSYGKTKLAGDEAILNTEVPHLILRTGWVYGLRGSNFLLTILRLASEKNELTIVDDQHGAPTWSRMIAEATAQVIAKEKIIKSIHGIYHLTAAGETTWFGFAGSILEHTKNNRQHMPTLKPIETAAYASPARRPLNSLMDNTMICEKYAISLPDWRQQLELALHGN